MRRRVRLKNRNEEARAAGRLNPYWEVTFSCHKIWEVTFTQRCLTRHLRVTEVQILHAHGKVHLPDIPCEKEARIWYEKGRRQEEEKMRK